MVDGDSPADWPPAGYTEGVKVSNGRKIKFYTHVETGKKFYSKKEVTRYMNSKDTCDGVTLVKCEDNSCTEKNVGQMNYQEKSCSKNNLSQVNYQDKSSTENNTSQIVVGTEISHEGLPPGWIVELRNRKSGSHAGSTYKVYIDPSTGNKLYSMPEVSRYLKTMKPDNIAGEQGTAEISSSNQKASENSKDVGGRSLLTKRRKSNIDQSAKGAEEGSPSKQITSQYSKEAEPSCMSKRQKSGNNRASLKTSPAQGAGKDFSNEKASHDSKVNVAPAPLSKRKTRGTDSPSAKTVCSVAVDYDSVDELPPGWKTEVVIRKNDRGIRKDPLYTDPVHGYVFRSKKEVFRYLQTGDTSRCTRRSSKRNAASTEQDNSTTEDASVKKSGCFVTGRQLFAAEDPKGGKSFVTCSPAQVESSKEQPDGSVSDPNTIITSILAEINENHSLENINEDAEIGLSGATESAGVKRLSSVSTPQSGLQTEKHLPGNELEKRSCRSVTEQSLKSGKTKSLKPGFRASKRLAGHSPEVAGHLDLGEHALPAVVEKSASLSSPLNVSDPEMLQQSVPTLESGNCSQASLSGSASELPPGWKKEYKITKKANGIRKDPLYIDPVHGYVFFSKKDVFRYLESGDIKSCAIRPAKRDLDATTKESCPTTLNTSSKNIGCSETKRQPSAAEGSRGRKRSVTYPLEVQTKSSKKQPESNGSNPNNFITSSAADINAKHSYESVIGNAEKIVDTEPERRDSSRDTKAIAAESVDVKRVSAVSAPKSDVLAKQQLLGNEPEKHINKETVEQSKRSRNKKLHTLGHRTSKRLVGQNPEPVADLDLGERAFRAVVKKSASLGLHLNVSGQEILAQNKDPAAGTDNTEQASLSRDTSVDEISPGWEKEKITVNKDAIVGTGNSDQASLSREASVDELPRGREKEVLARNEVPALGTGISDQASLSREASVDELPPSREKEVLEQNKVPAVGTGISDQDSMSREASEDDLPPGWTKEMLAQNKDPIAGAGNSDQASLSREISEDELPPGWTKEMLVQKRYPTVGTSYPDQASLIGEASVDDLPPGWTKEMVARKRYPTVGNCDQASLRREASVDELPPGWTKEMLARSRYPTVGNGYSDQASLSREASVDELPPGWTKEMLALKRYPTAGICYSDQASLGREASVDKLPPGWTKEMLAQSKNPKVGSGNSDQAYLRREASVDELPPGWIKEMRIRKNSRGTKMDPFYTHPLHAYEFRSKRDVMRYLQTGDISVCAVRPTKKRTGFTREDNSTSTHDANSNKFGCSSAGRQLFATEESKGGKCSITYSLDLQAGSSNEQPESTVFNSKTSVPSIVADITGKRSCGYTNEDAEVRLYMEPEIRGSTGDAKAVASESVDVQQLPENEKKRRSNKGASGQSRKYRNNESDSPVRWVSKRRSLYNPEVVADLNLVEPVLPAVVKKSVLSGLPLNVSGPEFPQQTDLTTGTFDPAFLSKNASSQDDPLEVFVKCPSEGHTFKEQKAAMELTSEKQDDVKRILHDSHPAGMSYGSGNVQLMQQEVKEGRTRELLKEEQDSRKRFLKNLQPAEFAWESGKLPVEYQSTSERLTAVQVTEKRNHEKMHWQDSQLAELSQRNGGLNLAGQSIGDKQTGVSVTENQDDQSRRLHVQLGPCPIGDYWSDPCMEFAFKTLTGALPVEDPLPFQGPSQQEFGTSYDGCFDLPVFNTSNFYMNDVPNHCAPTGEHVTRMQPSIDLMQPPIDLMQPPIDLNETFTPSGNISMPGCSSVTSQNPGLDTQANDYQSVFKSESWNRSSYNATSQNPGLDTQAKDYQPVFKSQSWNRSS